MTYRFGFGGFPAFVIDEYLYPGEIQVTQVPSLTQLMELPKYALSQWLTDFNDLDFVVFRLSGENPLEFINILKFRGLIQQFKLRKYSVSFWTMDSHHLGNQESRAQKFFDHVFVAHESYLDLFSASSTTFLPCSYSLTSENRLEKILLDTRCSSPENAGGVSAVFVAYPWYQRNATYFAALEKARVIGTPTFFGTIRGGLSYGNQGTIQKTLSFKATLNFSLRSDLNMRNFEALALNRILISNQSSAHTILSPWKENISFVNNDLSNLKDVLLDLDDRKPGAISSDFLAVHSIRVRIETIFFTLTGVEYLVRERVPSDFESDFESCGADVGKIDETEHALATLLGRAGWPGVRMICKLWQMSPIPLKATINFLGEFLVSGFQATLRGTLGKIPALRAIMRMRKSAL